MFLKTEFISPRTYRCLLASVAMTVLAFLPVPPETKGLIAIPCVTSHLTQIFLDAFLATRWGHTT